jgi:hypothetical protein
MKKPVLLTLFIFSLLSVSVLLAQDVTATPAPPKTPTSDPETTPISSEVVSPSVEPREIIEPFSQEQLQVLVGNVQRPNGIVWFNGNLYTACNGDYTLYEVNAETGRTRTLVFGVQNAHTMYAEAVDQAYELWIPDFDTNQLLRYNSTRNATRQIASEALNGPWGIVPFNESEFLITNIRGNNIVSVSREGDVREVATGFRAPAGIAIDAEQEIVYVVNNGSARRAIEWFALSDLSDDTPVVDIGKPLVSGLQNPSGIILAPDGYLYFTYSLGTRGVVGRVNPSECIDGGCTNEQVEIVVYTDLQAPLAGLAISPDMRLFVHTIFRPEIYWVDLYN